MTDQTDHLLLEDAAAHALAKQQDRQAQQDADLRRDYERDAVKHGHDVAQEILGPYADRGTWRAIGETPQDEPWPWWATAEIDGLRFLVRGRGGFPPYGSASLYLQLPCPKNDGGGTHGEAYRGILVTGLAHLGVILADPARQSGTCPACDLLKAEQREAAEAKAPTTEELLMRALGQFIDERVDDKLDGFLATYLPDRI